MVDDSSHGFDLDPEAAFQRVVVLADDGASLRVPSPVVTEARDGVESVRGSVTAREAETRLTGQTVEPTDGVGRDPAGAGGRCPTKGAGRRPGVAGDSGGNAFQRTGSETTDTPGRRGVFRLETSVHI